MLNTDFRCRELVSWLRTCVACLASDELSGLLHLLADVAEVCPLSLLGWQIIVIRGKDGAVATAQQVGLQRVGGHPPQQRCLGGTQQRHAVVALRILRDGV